MGRLANDVGGGRPRIVGKKQASDTEESGSALGFKMLRYERLGCSCLMRTGNSPIRTQGGVSWVHNGRAISNLRAGRQLTYKASQL